MKFSRMGYWKLDAENHVVRAKNLHDWAQWFEDGGNRIVEQTTVGQGIVVSTVFLGLDHRFHGDGPPSVGETMVFGGPLHGEMDRYSSWDDAETGHKMMVKRVLTVMKAKAKAKT
jgi:hypothetical protein